MARRITGADVTAAKRLRAIWDKKRRILGIDTQEAAAQALGITQGAVNHYLNGRAALGPVATLKFAKLLKVRPTEIREDFEFTLDPAELPDDVVATAILLATLPREIRENFAKMVKTLADVTPSPKKNSATTK